MIEQLMVMSIMIIMLVAAVPSFTPITQQTQQNASLQKWMNDYSFAKTEANRLGGITIICPTSDGQACAPSDKLIDWGQGWLVFFDSNGNNILDQDEKILKRSNKFAKNFSLFSTNNISLISIDQFGLTKTNNNDSGILLLKLASDKNHTHCIQIGQSSQPKVIKYGQTSCK